MFIEDYILVESKRFCRFCKIPQEGDTQDIINSDLSEKSPSFHANLCSKFSQSESSMATISQTWENHHLQPYSQFLFKKSDQNFSPKESIRANSNPNSSNVYHQSFPNQIYQKLMKSHKSFPILILIFRKCH